MDFSFNQDLDQDDEELIQILKLNIQQCQQCQKIGKHDCEIEYQEIPCPYCGDKIVRAFLKDHLEDCIAHIEHQFSSQNTYQECSICMEEILPKTESNLKCQHRFHQKCIDQWYLKKKECPLCRQSI